MKIKILIVIIIETVIISINIIKMIIILYKQIKKIIIYLHMRMMKEEDKV